MTLPPIARLNCHGCGRIITEGYYSTFIGGVRRNYHPLCKPIKEKFMIKNVRTAIVLMALACLSACEFDPDVELNGAQVVSQGQCANAGRVYACLGIEKDGKKYFVGMDSQGPFAVWSVKEWKRDYEEKDITLVWERDNKGRRKSEV